MQYGRSLGLVFFGCLLMSATVSAQTEFAQLAQTWTGLEKFRNQLSEVKLVIEADTSGGEDAAGQRPITGTISHRPVVLTGRGRGGVAPAELENIVGDYFPAVKLLRFRIDGPWSGGSTMYAVLNDNGSEMALVYTGAGRNNLPYLLSAGDAFPAEVEKFVPGAPAGIAAQQAQAQSAATSQAELTGRVVTLQTEMLAALSSGNAELGRQLQQQLQQLQQEMVNLQRQQLEQQRQALVAQTANGGGTPQQQMAAAQLKIQEASRSGDQAAILAAQQEFQQVIMSLAGGVGVAGVAPSQAQSCPESIVNWVLQMNAQGASFVEFNGTIEVSNLFRPSGFQPFFGTTFADMPNSEKFNTGMSLQRSCAVQGTEFYTSGNTTALMGAFGEQGGYSMVDAGIAGLALEHIAQWVDATLSDLENTGSWDTAKQMEALYQPLLTAIWPIEAQAAEIQLVEIKNTQGFADLSQQYFAIAGRVSAEGASALREIVALRRSDIYQEFDSTTKNRFDQLLDSETDQVLTAYINAAPESSVAMSSIAALAENKNWYASHADIFAALADLSVVARYQADLGHQRELAMRDLQAQIENDLAQLNSRVAVIEYGGDFVLALDNQYSPTWQGLEQRRAERIIEVEWEVHVARVGEGPFDANHPGAVYLNAIYRNDLAMIREEDTNYSQPFRSFMNPLSESGFFELIPFFTGDLYSAEDMQGYLEREIDNMTVLDTIAGFFVVSYQHAYAECMDPTPVRIERTVFWDVVTTNGWGDELWRTTESATYNYVLNNRHVAVFNEVGVGQDPEEANMVSSLFGAFLPQNLKNSFSIMSDALKGMRMGMQQLACDDPQMQQLERNLIALVLR